MRTAIPITDVATGLYAAIAVLSALFHRERTGQGQHIDSSMLDASVALNGHLAMGFLMSGVSPTRVGNTNPIAAPSEVLACADGHLIVAAGNNTQFQGLCKALRRPELADDERFKTNSHRVASRAALRTIIAPLVASWKQADLLKALDQAGVPCGPINDMAQVFAEPQTQHRELALSLPHGRGVSIPCVRSPLRFSETPVQHRSPPMLGAHTMQVLQDELKISDEQFQRLQKQGVV